MPKKIQITIHESAKDLQALLRKAKSDRQRGRLKTLLLLKQGKVEYQSQLSVKLGFTEKTIRGWLKRYVRDGITSFITINVGGNNKGHLSDKVIAFVSEKLSNPATTITSYVELRALIEQELGEAVNYGALYAHCRRKHQSKLKVSRKSHHKKDPQAETVFKKRLKAPLN